MALDPEVERLKLEQQFEIERLQTVDAFKRQQISEAINQVDFNVRQLSAEPDQFGFNVRQLSIEPDTPVNMANDDSLDNVTVSINGNPTTSNNSNDVLDLNPRLKNVLGRFSSVTYQLTLYMITADAYNAFVAGGRKNINVFKDWQNSGTYIVAQSGGVNSGSEDRPPGLNLDYYIDNLRIQNKIAAASNLTASNLTSISFDIHEPYGFSFINKLAEAHRILKSKTKLANAQDTYHSTRQFFVLGIRYNGYDSEGNIVTKESDLGLKPVLENESQSLFETFFEIFIINMKFRIGPGVTVYSVEAKPITNVAYGYKYGRISTGVEVIAENVGEALSGTNHSLISKLNYDEYKLYEKGYVEQPNEYYVEFVGPGSDLIKNSKLYSKNDSYYHSWPMALVDKLSDVNDYTSLKAVPDSTKRMITFRQDTSILQAIENIIKQSTYLSNALNKIYNSELEAKTTNKNEESKSPNTSIAWYNLTSKMECKGWDNKRNDWVFKITYYIQRYETPFVISPYVRYLNRDYRPHKRYDYYFTGKNTEILSYDQTINNQWLNAEVGINKKDGQENGMGIPNVPNKLTGGDRTGKVDIGLEAQNNFVNNLYDPKSWVNAKIQILGDPDFLIRENISDINNLYRQYYGDGFSVNANGGQVFIEIDFKEGVDYDHSKGLMNVNDQLTFWTYPESVKKHIKGVSYQVISIDSEFNGGKFIQNLECIINTNVSAPKEIDESAARETLNDRLDTLSDSSRFYTDSATNYSSNNTETNKYINTAINSNSVPDKPINTATTNNVVPRVFSDDNSYSSYFNNGQDFYGEG